MFGSIALVLASIALALAGCSSLPGSGPVVRFDNQTNTPMALHVKGTWVGTYAPGATANVLLAAHGQPPYVVTVQSPGGETLLELEFTAEDIARIADGTGAAATTALPCGTVQLSFGPSLQTPPAIAFAQLPACP